MTKLPIHTLLDKDKKPFIPFVTAKCIPLDGTSDTVYDRLEALNNKEVVQPSVATEVTAVYNYQTLPVSDVTPTEDTQFTNKKYVDETVANVDVQGGGMSVTYLSENSRSNPMILTQAKAGIYVMPNYSFYFKKEETDSYVYDEALLDKTVYVLKDYEDAEEGEIFLHYMKRQGRTGCAIKTSTGVSTGEKSTASYILHADSSPGISGLFTFTRLPESTVVPTTDAQFTNKKYVDEAIANLDVGDGGCQIKYLSEVDSMNPFIIENAKAGIYIFPTENIYIKWKESTPLRTYYSFDCTLYIGKAYAEAEDGERIGYFVDKDSIIYHLYRAGSSGSMMGINLGKLVKDSREATISGQHTYTKLPKSTVIPTDNDQFVNKAYVDNAVANAAPTVDTTTLLNYKGHVASVEDLDSTGQPSGTLTDQFMGIDNTILGTDETAIAAIKSLVGDAYFLGVYKSPTDYLIISSTDSDAFKDISFIKSGFGSTDAATSTYAFVVVDESKEHNIQICCNAGRSVAYLKTPSGSGTLQPSENYKGTATKLKSVQLYAGADACLYGNVPNVLNYVNTPYAGIFSVNSQGNFWTDQASGMTCLRLNFENNYIYNEGMQCLKSNGDGTLSWVLTDSVAQINDMRTVGDSHEIYVCMPGYVWTRWNNTYSKSEIDEMLGNAEAVLTEVLEGTAI